MQPLWTQVQLAATVKGDGLQSRALHHQAQQPTSAELTPERSWGSHSVQNLVILRKRERGGSEENAKHEVQWLVSEAFKQMLGLTTASYRSCWVLWRQRSKTSAGSCTPGTCTLALHTLLACKRLVHGECPSTPAQLDLLPLCSPSGSQLPCSVLEPRCLFPTCGSVWHVARSQSWPTWVCHPAGMWTEDWPQFAFQAYKPLLRAWVFPKAWCFLLVSA